MTTSAELNQQLISAVKAGKIHAAMKEKRNSTISLIDSKILN